jgi:hypothetical protein
MLQLVIDHEAEGFPRQQSRRGVVEAGIGHQHHNINDAGGGRLPGSAADQARIAVSK